MTVWRGKTQMGHGKVRLAKKWPKRFRRVIPRREAKPYHGYYFKVLKGQGPAAPMGEMDFMVGGAMIGGFALAAAPAEYRVTGVMTFIVGPDGVVYEKDLGPDTLKTFQSMDKYNPDKTWKVTEDDVEDDSSDQGSESQTQ